MYDGRQITLHSVFAFFHIRILDSLCSLLCYVMLCYEFKIKDSEKEVHQPTVGTSFCLFGEMWAGSFSVSEHSNKSVAQINP